MKLAKMTPIEFKHNYPATIVEAFMDEEGSYFPEELRAGDRRGLAEQRARMSGLRLDRERARREADQFRAETRELTDAVERDSLTGIGNRRAFDRALGVLLSQGDARCTLALIDCDHFKAVNDRVSHLAGDRVLQRIAKVLTQASRKSDLAARFGGDEFAVVFADAGRDEAANVCEPIRAAIEQYADDGAPAVTVSTWRPL